MAASGTNLLPAITGVHSGFPQVLRAADFDPAAIDGGSLSLSNGGGDLRIYSDATKTTRLPIDVVRFVTGGTPDIEVHFRHPSAYTNAPYHIERSATESVQPAEWEPYGRDAVWSDYYAVLHMNDGSYIDATGNGHDGAVTGTLSQTTTSHPWGGEWTSFDNNVNEYITINGSSDFGDATSDVTISAWSKANADGTGGIISNRLSSEEGDWFQINKRSSANEWQFSAHDGAYLGEVYVKPIAATADPHLFHLAIDSGSVIPSVDGSSTGTLTLSGDGILNSSKPITVGHYYDLSVTAYDYYGHIGEVRLRESYLSIDWRATEYSNQSAPGAWGTVGTWSDSAGTTPVTKDLTTQWNVLEQLTTDHATRWDILNAVDTDLQTAWHLLNKVTKDEFTSWDILQQLSKDVNISWDIIAALFHITSDMNMRWNIINAVQKDVQTAWQLLNSVIKSQSFSWHLLNAMTKDVQTDWHILESVERDVAITWDVDSSLTAVTKDIDLRYNILQAITTSFDSQWNLLEAVTQDQDIRFDIANAVVTALGAGWNIVNGVATDLPLRWNSLELMQNSLTLTWSVDGLAITPITFIPVRPEIRQIPVPLENRIIPVRRN
ncbi:LamG domain-containing protein [Sedimenticola selenatireducens]|uniref:LamG domain-containing protein n=1 Tax=Sedimenticola selenatireducens TaxID=191960 RepID=A0A557S0F1_9GAMM|nr:LamG domain-containing protein [Sedimenticola selenatireducens]TVO70893.1 LamG domain-containing protein [Sedimenticola selenatireducens]